jgi:hypothetical protein
MALAEEAPPVPAPGEEAPMTSGPTPVALPPEPEPEPRPGRSRSRRDRGQDLLQAITLGFRGGWAHPLGTFAGKVGSWATLRFEDQVVQAFPFTIEVGYRVADRFTFGAYFSYGVAELQPDALDGACSSAPLSCERGRTQRLGAQLHYQITRVGPLRPWAGLGFGYEWLRLEMKDEDSRADLGFEGMEVLNLQAGADFAISRGVRVGPWAALTFARFERGEVGIEDATGAFDFAKPRFHEWLIVGLRGALEP